MRISICATQVSRACLNANTAASERFAGINTFWSLTSPWCQVQVFCTSQDRASAVLRRCHEAGMHLLSQQQLEAATISTTSTLAESRQKNIDSTLGKSRNGWSLPWCIACSTLAGRRIQPSARQCCQAGRRLQQMPGHRPSRLKSHHLLGVPRRSHKNRPSRPRDPVRPDRG